MDFKKIHIGTFIKNRAQENNITMERLCKYFNCTERDIEIIYKKNSLDTEFLLKWCKILEYDFFRIYTQHLILYCPPSKIVHNTKKNEQQISPKFRKNIYTAEIIEFILEQISSGEKTIPQIIENYGIPKTTLYTWIKKYNSDISKGIP